MKKEKLSEEQIKTLEIIEHIQLQLSILEYDEKLEIQEYWYASTKEMLKEYIRPKFIDALAKPEGQKALNFKIVNRKLIKDFIWKIRELPQSILITNGINKSPIIPNELTINTRGYIKKLSNQINITYQNRCFDACAMCMRRLLEILLILTYQINNKENDIKEDDSYKNLSSIINFTKSNNYFKLSKKALETMHEFRKLGNHSAHSIQYNCLKKEIDEIKREFRVTIEELLYKSKIKK